MNANCFSTVLYFSKSSGERVRSEPARDPAPLFTRNTIGAEPGGAGAQKQIILRVNSYVFVLLVDHFASARANCSWIDGICASTAVAQNASTAQIKDGPLNPSPKRRCASDIVV